MTNPDSPFLPVGELPRTEWAGRSPCNWLWDFEREEFEKAAGHPLFSENDVEYRFNTHGYRCPEFSEEAEIRIIAIGCSYVFGYALPQHLIFPELIRSKIEASTGKSTILWNLGLGGASNYYISRVLHLAVPVLLPNFVIINFTFGARREHFGLDGENYSFLPGVEPIWNQEFMDSFRHISALGNKHNDRANFFRNYKSCEALLRNIPWLYSTASVRVLRSLAGHLDMARCIGSFSEGPGPLDYARDMSHPGPKEHIRIAEEYWKKIKTIGLEKLCKT